MNQELVKAFKNDKFGNVRVVLIGESKEPYFVGKDVAECLGYSNSSKAVSTHVDEEDRILETIEASSQNGNVVKTQTTLINESGLYSLILSSKLPQAKEFKRWVTSEVLPSIRKTGTYSTGQKPTSAMEELRLHYKALEEHSQEIQEVKAEVADLKDNMPLFNVECKEIQSLVKKKGTNVLGGYKSNAYNDNSLRGKVYSDIQKQLRREFGVEKYEAIKRSQFDIAKQIVNEYKAPIVLIQEINALNSQTTLFDKKEEKGA